MHSKKQYWLTGILVMAVSSFGLMGCEEDKVAEPDNYAPVIASITASPDTMINRGGTVTLIAVVTDEDGDAINYEWSALSGTFSATDDDTVTWTAPDDVGVVTINLEVDDGQAITTGSRDVGVEVYVPAVQPYYVGMQSCVCHSSVVTAFEATNHATAFDRKKEEEGDGFSSYCYRCHTVGNDTSIDNGGYDENPVSELEGIQCENCHGPGSAHIASQSADDITVSNVEDQCAGCHVSSRNNTWADWEVHNHNVGTTIYEGSYYSGCGYRCHTGQGYVEEVSGAASSDTTFASINCVTCHDPHDNTNEHLVRKYPSGVTTPYGDVVTDGGLGNLCLGCHTGRRSVTDVADQVNTGSSHFGPHHGNQGAFLYPEVFFDVWNGAFTWSSTQHMQIEDSCVSCHMVGHDGVNQYGNPLTSEHAYEPDVEACEPCHGVLTTFDDVIAKEDFDGDGTIEGVQSEVTGLRTVLENAIIATGIDSLTTLGLKTVVGRDSTDGVWDTVNANGVWWPSQIRGAAFNLLAVEYDQSNGVHNAAFTVQLLQQSYKYLTGNDVAGAYMLMPGER